MAVIFVPIVHWEETERAFCGTRSYNLENMNALTMASNIASIILAIVAIGLSAYFYSQSKNTEKEITNALAGIRAQTDTLQKLTSKQMDRLIRGVIEPNQNQATLISAMVSILREIPGSIVSQLQGASVSASNQELRNELIAGYIGIYYYAGIANVACQGYLPSFSELRDDTPAKVWVDQTYHDFQTLESILGNLDQASLQGHQLYHLYVDAIARWRPLVKDAHGLLEILI